MSAPTKVKRFRCPACGDRRSWRAEYYQAVTQGVTLLAGDDGPEPADYAGDEDTCDDGSTDNEAYRCACGYVITEGEFRMLAPADVALLKAAPRLLDLLARAVDYARLDDAQVGNSDDVHAMTSRRDTLGNRLYLLADDAQRLLAEVRP